MKRVKSTLKKITLIIFVVTGVVLSVLPVLSAEPHENPETAEVVFSGLALFQFYSDTLDGVLIRSQQDIETSIGKSPFANVPSSLEDSLADFVNSANTVCLNILELDDNVNDIRLLLQQSRYQEAGTLIEEMVDTTLLTEEEINVIEDSAERAGDAFLVSSVSEDSSIYLAYAGVLDKIQRLRDLLGLYGSLLEELKSEQLNQTVLQTTELTLRIEPVEAFVGDIIKVEGALYTDSEALTGREIEIMLNGLPSLTLTTDDNGYYSGVLEVPYWYIDVIEVQSLYYPQSEDVGIYRASLSSTIDLKVLFYDGQLILETEENAYPGKETSVGGQFDYGSASPPGNREIEIYLDNRLVIESEADAEFTETVMLPDDIKTGKHLITVSVPAHGRYAPITAEAVLNVQKITPVLTIDYPSLAFIPGSFVVTGKLDSDLGIVDGAIVIIDFGGREYAAVSGDDGTFSTIVKNGMGMGLFGNQSLEITVASQKPWQSSFSGSYKIYAVYILNCVLFLFILVFIGVILPRRFKLKDFTGFRKKEREPLIIPPPEPVPAPVAQIPEAVYFEEGKHGKDDSRTRLLKLYGLLIQLVQKVSGIIFKPSQTLREFAGETNKKTGIAGKYILEFTKMVEKVLYSSYKVTEEDTKSGERLIHEVRENLKR